MNIGIYAIINLTNGKRYIGSSRNIRKRFLRHINDLKNNKHHNCHLQRSWIKYGKSCFKFEVVEYCELIDLEEIEQSYIDSIFENEKHYDLYYNIGKKACGGDNITNNPNREEIIEKMSNSMKKRYSEMSEEDKLKRSESIMGENNPNYGNKWSDELRKSVSDNAKNNNKYKNNYINGKTWEEYYGAEKSNELKENISKIASERTGDKNPFYNKTHSDETKKMISERNKNKKVFSLLKPFEIDGEIYLSLGDASNELDICFTTIRHRIISKNIKFSEYKYITDEIKLMELKEKYKDIFR